MRIALVSPYDAAFPGGVIEHISHLDEELCRLGHEVTIIAPSSIRRPVVPYGPVFRAGGIVAVPANGSVARISLSLRLSGRVKRLLQREAYDVVHLHEPLLPALPLTVLRHSHAVNVGTFHACWASSAGYHYLRPILNRFMAKLDARIAVSAAACRFVAEQFPGDYTLIPNGVDLRRFNPEVPPIPELADGKRNILFVGRIEKRKGLRYLLQAYAELKRRDDGIRLIVLGACREGLRAHRAYADEQGLRDVVFAGYVPALDLPSYYAAADVFCAPSTGGESFGIVLLEAMASGKPIVASDIEGYRAVVQHGSEGLLVPPRDAGALASALQSYLSDPELRRAAGAAGLDKARGYAWPRIAGRVLDCYESAQRRRARGGRRQTGLPV